MIDKPDVRKKRWRKAVRLSAGLGEDFLELVESGRIRQAVGKTLMGRAYPVTVPVKGGSLQEMLGRCELCPRKCRD